jgi:outer membrane protein assembly factor BamB
LFGCAIVVAMVYRCWPKARSAIPAELGWYDEQDTLPEAGLASLELPPTSPESRDIYLARSTQGWPNFLGPSHDSVSLEADVVTEWPANGPREKWRREIGYGYSAPICLDDYLVAFHRVGDEEIVQCFHPESGECRWDFRYPTTFKCGSHYSDGPYSTPVMDAHHVFALGAQGQLHCLDLHGGKLIWRRHLLDDYRVELDVFPVGTSPLLEGDRLVINIGGRTTGAGIVAIDAATGETVWTATDHGASFATPCAATIHGHRHLFVWTEQALVDLDPETGQVRWKIPFRAKSPETAHATSPVVFEDIVFLSGYQAGCLCVRVLADGRYEELWRDKRRVLDSQYNNLLCLDGYAYGCSALQASLRCLHLTTGELQWRWRGRIREGATVAVGDRILLLGNHGRLASLDVDPEKPRLRAMTAKPIMESPCYTAPALHRGLLYLRNEGTLLCLDLRNPYLAEEEGEESRMALSHKPLPPVQHE